MTSAGQATSIEAEASREGLLSATTVAVLSRVAQSSAGEVVATTVMLALGSSLVVPAARSPNEQLNVCAPRAPVICQVPGPEYAGSMLQLRLPLSPAGSGSWSVALSAVPGPMFQTTIVKLAWSPPWIAGSAAILAMFRPGHSTVTDACGCRVALLLAVTVATFGNVAQSSAEVPLTMWTETPVPEASVPKLQFRVWVPGSPLIEHGSPSGWLAIDQLRSAPAGSGSLSVTSWASPSPSFMTAMVK